MKKKILISLLSIVSVAFFYQDFIWGYNSVSGAEFLSIELSPRSAGVGSSYISQMKDISALNINPAGIAYMKAPQVYYMHNSAMSEFSAEYLVVGTPMAMFIKSSRSLPKKLRWIRDLRVGASLMYWHTSEIDVIGNDSNSSVGKINLYDLFASVGLAYKFKGNFIGGTRVGGSFRFIKRSIDEYSSSTVSFDLSILRPLQVPRFIPYPKRYNLRIAFAMTNLGPSIDFDGLSESLPTTFRGAVMYGIFGNRLHLIDISLGFTKLIEENFYFNAGLEYNILKIFFFRLGTELASGDFNLNMGTGFKYKFRKVIYRADYAYVPKRQGIPDNHSFSLQADFRFFKVGKHKRITSFGILETNSDKDKKKDKKSVDVKSDDKNDSSKLKEKKNNSSKNDTGKIKLKKSNVIIAP